MSAAGRAIILAAGKSLQLDGISKILNRHPADGRTIWIGPSRLLRANASRLSWASGQSRLCRPILAWTTSIILNGC